MKKLERGRKVIIDWEDIHDYAGEDWNDDPLAYPTASVMGLGWIAFDFSPRDSTLHLARDWDVDNDRPRSVIAIPAGAIPVCRDAETGKVLFELKYQPMHRWF